MSGINILIMIFVSQKVIKEFNPLSTLTDSRVFSGIVSFSMKLLLSAASVGVKIIVVDGNYDF